MVVCKFFQQGNCRYGNNCRFEHIYGSKYSYRAPQLQSARDVHDNYSTNSSELGLKNSASSLFRSAVQNSSSYQNAPYQNSSNHTFIQSQPVRPSVFERLGPQINVTSNQNNQAKSIFAQANKNVFGPTQPAANVFQTQSNAKSLFAQASQSMFGQNQSPNEYFVTEQQKTLPYSSNTANVFQRNNSPSNFFGTTVNEAQSNDYGIYNKMEELSQSDIEAFESATFKLGFIPELSPPIELC